MELSEIPKKVAGAIKGAYEASRVPSAEQTSEPSGLFVKPKGSELLEDLRKGIPEEKSTLLPTPKVKA